MITFTLRVNFISISLCYCLRLSKLSASTGSSLHLVPLPSCRSLRSSICRLCGLQVMRVSGLPRFVVRAAEGVPRLRAVLGCAARMPPKKRVLSLRRDLSPATDAVSFIMRLAFGHRLSAKRIITKILSQSKYLFAYRLEMFICFAAQV